MPILVEAARSVYGAYRLARFDAGGMAWIDTTARGAWRSFFAAIVLAPFYVLLMALLYPLQAAGTDPMRFAVVSALAYVIAWFAYPVVMVSVCDRLGRGDRFTAFLSAYNWSAVIRNAVFIPLDMLLTLGLIGPAAGSIAWLIAFAAVLAYAWFITRTTLAVPGAAAAGIVALDVAISYAVNGIAQTLYAG